MKRGYELKEMDVRLAIICIHDHKLRIRNSKDWQNWKRNYRDADGRESWVKEAQTSPGDSD